MTPNGPNYDPQDWAKFRGRMEEMHKETLRRMDRLERDVEVVKRRISWFNGALAIGLPTLSFVMAWVVQHMAGG